MSEKIYASQEWVEEKLSTAGGKTHTHSYNDLEDKPFGEEITETPYLEEMAFSGNFTEVNTPIHLDELYIVYFDGIRYECAPWNYINDYNGIGNDNVWHGGEGGVDSGEPFVVYDWSDGINIKTIDSGEHTISIFKAEPTVYHINEKYIPDTIARIDDIPSITTATVGQTIVVKAVDENGKPTEWEAVDMSSSLPAVNAADNGKILMVVNGKYQLVAINLSIDDNGVVSMA